MAAYAQSHPRPVALPKIKANSQTVLRGLLASYFAGTAFGLVNGPDATKALATILPEHSAATTNGALLLVLSAMILSQNARKGSVLALGILVFCVSTVTVLPFIGNGSGEGLLRDTTLLAALILTYAKAGPKNPARRPSAVAPSMSQRQLRRVNRAGPVTPRRVKPMTQHRALSASRPTHEIKIEKNIKNDVQDTDTKNIFEIRIAEELTESDSNEVTNEASTTVKPQEQILPTTSQIHSALVPLAPMVNADAKIDFPLEFRLPAATAETCIVAPKQLDEDTATDEAISQLVASNVAFLTENSGRSIPRA